MPEYLVTDPESGQKRKLTGDAPPTEAELDAIFGSSFGAFEQRASTTFINNALGLPGGISKIAGTALAQGAAALGAGEGDFFDRVEQQKARAPASGLLAFPQPKVSDIASLIKSIPALLPGGKTPGEAFRGHQEGAAAKEAALRGAHPKATAAGDVAGDVLTLASGRLPAAKAIAKAELKLAPKVADMAFGSALAKPLDPGTARLANRIINSPKMRALARGLGRSVETGFEAMVLDIVKGDDPMETAAYAAGGQLAGSALLTAGKGLISGGPLKAGGKLAIAAASTAALLQMLKNVTPGGEDNFISNINDGFDKVTLALALGIISGLAGAGRLRGGKLAEDLPKLTDAIATIPRAATISILEDWVNASGPERLKIESDLQKQAQ